MNSPTHISEYFITNHTLEAVRTLENIKINELVEFLLAIPQSLTVMIFTYLERYTAVKCIEKLPLPNSVRIIEQIPVDHAIVFLQRIDADLYAQIIGSIKKESADIIKRILNYPQNSAGALADPLVLTLPQDITVKEAMARVQKRPQQAMFYLYIVNRKQALVGIITLRDLMLADHSDLLLAIMESNISSISAESGLSAILHHPGWQQFHLMPVVEENDIFLGVLRYETLRRIEKENLNKRLPRHAMETSNALSELYRIGISSMVQSAAPPAKKR